MWIKLGVFAVVVHVTLALIALGGPWLKVAMVAVAAVGSRELTGVLLAPGPEQRPYRWLAVGGAMAITAVAGPAGTEIQALVVASGLGTPRRAVVGWDTNRLAMLLAVIDARCGIGFANHDVYLNVAGGLRIGEPAADLAVAASVVSSLADQPVPADMVVFGEIGLGGEVRPVGQREARLREAAKLGFRRALVPKSRAGSPSVTRAEGIGIDEIEHLADLVARFEPADRPLKRSRQRE